VIASPLVSIVVLNYNGKDLVANCLKSLAATEFEDYEILVVDNGSTDGSVEYLKANYSANPRIIVHENKKNLGFAGGNNVGIGLARGKYIVLLNDDVQVKSDWLKNLVKLIEGDPTIGAAQCKLLLDSDRSTFDSAGSYMTSRVPVP